MRFLLVSPLYTHFSPVFTTPIHLDYFFEEAQKLKFVVVDVDKDNDRLEDQELIGTVEVTVASVRTPLHIVAITDDLQ